MLDNSSTYKNDEEKAWLAEQPRFQLHLTPTSAPRMNLVERFFAEITRKHIQYGARTSVAELEDAIHDYLLDHNADSKLLVWTKSAEVICRKSAERPTLWRPSKATNGQRQYTRVQRGWS